MSCSSGLDVWLAGRARSASSLVTGPIETIAWPRERRSLVADGQEETHRRGGGEGDVVGRARSAQRPAPTAARRPSHTARARPPRRHARAARPAAPRAPWLARATSARRTGDVRAAPRRATRRRSARARCRRRSRARPAPRAVPGPIAAMRTPASERASRPPARQALEQGVHAVGARQADQVIGRRIERRAVGSIRVRIVGACTTRAPSDSKPSREFAGLRARARDRHRAPGQRARRQPVQAAGQPGDRADDSDRWRSHLLALRHLGDRLQRARDGALVG